MGHRSFLAYPTYYLARIFVISEYFSTCVDGYLKVYLRGQEATDSYDKHDAELCGESTGPAGEEPAFPPPLLSDGPRLVMVFSSGELQGRGFKAKYTFETGKLLVPIEVGFI